MATVVQPLDIFGTRPDITNTPELVYVAGTNFPFDGLAFPSGGSKALYAKLGAALYGNSGNWTLSLQWVSRTPSTSGNVQWVAALAAISPGDAQSVLTKSFATSQNTTTTVNSTASGDTLTQITISNLNSVAAGDVLWIKLIRGTDTMVGDAVLIYADVAYDDGTTGAPGTGDVVGPASATDTAFARYNSTTGKLIENSVVLCDSSGNITGIASINAGIIMPSMCRLTSAFTSSGTSLQDITGTSITVPAAGTYTFEYELAYQVSSAANANAFAVNVTGGTISGYLLNALKGTGATGVADGVQTTNNTATVSILTGTTGTNFVAKLQGSFVCTSSGTIIARCSMATSGTVTVAIGSWGRLTKIA